MWHIKSTCTERLWSWHTPMKCFRHTHAFDKRCRQTCLQTISTVNEHTTVNNAHLRVQPRIRQVFVPFQNIFAGRDVHLHAENRMPLHVQHKNYGTQPHKESQHEPPGTLPPLSLKQVMLKYGKIALVMHSTVYIATLTCVYVGLQYGAPDTVAAVVEYATKTFNIDLTEGGPLIAAYLLTATTGPARGLATVVCTPIVARRVPAWMR